MQNSHSLLRSSLISVRMAEHFTITWNTHISSVLGEAQDISQSDDQSDNQSDVTSVHVLFCSFNNVNSWNIYKKRLEWSHQLPFSSHITNSEQDICQKLPFVAKSYHLLPKVSICCKKFPFVAKSYYLLPICCLPEPGQYVAFLNSKIMSNRATYCAGDKLSRDNICPGTICR